MTGDYKNATNSQHLNSLYQLYNCASLCTVIDTTCERPRRDTRALARLLRRNLMKKPPFKPATVRRTIVVAIASALCLALPACSSSNTGAGASSSSGAGGSAADDASGSAPAAGSDSGASLKVMQIAPYESQATSLPFMKTAAQAAVDEINDSGGVNGQQLELLTCNEKTDANEALRCAQKAVQEGVVAVVGSLTSNGAQMMPVLE